MAVLTGYWFIATRQKSAKNSIMNCNLDREAYKKTARTTFLPLGYMSENFTPLPNLQLRPDIA